MPARALPTMPTWSTGQEITSTLLNQITTYAQFWANPPEFKMYQSVAQTLTTAVTTAITMDTSRWDSDAGRSGASPYAYTVPFAGRWRFTWGVMFTGNATGVRASFLYQNGNPITDGGGQGGFHTTASAGNPVEQGSVTILCAAGDVISVEAQQTSGGNLATVSGGSWFEGKLESLANP